MCESVGLQKLYAQWLIAHWFVELGLYAETIFQCTYGVLVSDLALNHIAIRLIPEIP